jgi:hypothetical protein
MTQDEFDQLIDELAERFAAVNRLLSRADDGRQVGYWWEALSTIKYAEARQVVRRLFDGSLKFPFDADRLPGIIVQEVRMMRRRQDGSSSELAARQKDDVEAAESGYQQYQELEREYGPAFDSLPADSQQRIAANVLSDFDLRRWKRDRRAWFARFEILTHLEQEANQQPLEAVA